MISTANRTVKPLPGLAHGMATSRTPGSAHRAHVTRADQERLMLKGVQVPPGLLLGVMHRAAGEIVLRGREPRAAFEIDPQLKPTLTSIKEGLHDPPRCLQPKRRLKQLDVSHPARLRRSHAQPTRISQGPQSAFTARDRCVRIPLTLIPRAFYCGRQLLQRATQAIWSSG
jgi:hypothetical protein